jgi:hypothetical protein
MGVEILSPFVAKIGETAGDVWRHLEIQGPTSLTAIAVELGQPRDLVMLALGWLAREDKIDIVEESRKRTVSLKGDSP